jgi:hypothetical protein
VDVVEDWVFENIIVDDRLEILTDIGEATSEGIARYTLVRTLDSRFINIG